MSLDEQVTRDALESPEMHEEPHLMNPPHDDLGRAMRRPTRRPAVRTRLAEPWTVESSTGLARVRDRVRPSTHDKGERGERLRPGIDQPAPSASAGIRSRGRAPGVVAFAWRLQVVLGCIVAVCLAGCGAGNGVMRYEVDRVGNPVAFPDVRETAVWCEGFDPVWWPEVEQAYLAHADRVEEIARTEWRMHASGSEPSPARTGRPDLRQTHERHAAVRALDARLAASERAFLSTLREDLPPNASLFLDLLEARTDFHRAAGSLSDGWGRIPAPLEVVGMDGVAAIDRPALLSVTDAYRRLADVARSAVVRLADAGLGPGREVPERADRAPDEEEPAAGRPPEGTMGLVGAPLESLRAALYEEGRLVSMEIPDAARRHRALELLDEYLLVGVPPRVVVEAVCEVARRALGRRTPRDEKAEERFEAIATRVLAEHARLHAALASPSVLDRRVAFDSMRRLLEPVRLFFVASEPNTSITMTIGPRTSDWPDELRELGAIGPELSESPECLAEWARGILGRPSALDEGRTAVDFAAQPAREVVGLGELLDDRNRILEGRFEALAFMASAPLDASVLGRLAIELGFAEPGASQDALAAFAAGIAAESDALVASTTGPLEAHASRRAALEARVDAGDDVADEVEELHARSRELRARLESMDRRADERVVELAGRLAGVAPDDPRLVRAARRLEFRRLVPAHGASELARAAFGIAPFVCVDPVELLDECDLDRSDRAIADSVALEFSERVVDAARAFHGSMLADLEALMRSDAGAGQAWRAPARVEDRAAQVADAAALRVEFADELGRRLGPDARRATLEALARRATPGLLSSRSAAYAALHDFASGVDLDAMARVAHEPIRLSVAALLGQEGDERAEILREALLWSGAFGRVGPMMNGVEEWSACAARSPEGWRWYQKLVDAEVRAIARCETLLASREDFDPQAVPSVPLPTPPRRPPLRLRPFLDE